MPSFYGSGLAMIGETSVFLGFNTDRRHEGLDGYQIGFASTVHSLKANIACIDISYILTFYCCRKKLHVF